MTHTIKSVALFISKQNPGFWSQKISARMPLLDHEPWAGLGP